MKTIEEFYDQFRLEVKELWPADTVAALNEIVNAQTIVKYLYRDKVR